MSKEIDINMAEMAVATGDAVIRTGSIGSCIVIAVYDEEAKVGGMAHAILPSKEEKSADVIEEARANINSVEAVAKYADSSVDRLVSEVEKLGGKKERLKAKLVGGARMFKLLSGDKFGIGYRNIEAAKKRLSELNIPVISEETAGTVGRMAEFSLINGLMNVITKM